MSGWAAARGARSGSASTAATFASAAATASAAAAASCFAFESRFFAGLSAGSPRAATAAVGPVGLLAQFRQRRLRRVVVRQRVHQPVEPGEFRHRVGVVRRRVPQVLVAVQQHPELRAPVAEVVIADHLVPQEPQRAADGVPDGGAAEMADMHRLGDVRRGEIHRDRFRVRRERRSEPVVAAQVRRLAGQHVVPHPQVEEPRAGDLRLREQVRQVRGGGDLRGEVAGLLPDPLRQRHGEVRLEVPEPRVPGRADQRQELAGVRPVRQPRGEGGGEPLPGGEQKVHDSAARPGRVAKRRRAGRRGHARRRRPRRRA